MTWFLPVLAAVFNIGGGRRFGLPIAVHRVLPEEADITGARIVAERVAVHTHYSVHVTARVPAAPARVTGPTVAVHVGWRRDPDTDALRVATWRSSEPVTPPLHLTRGPNAVVVVDSATTGRIILPERMLAKLGRAAKTQSVRDRLLDQIRVRVVDYLVQYPQAAPVDADDLDVISVARVRAWKSPRRFAGLIRCWTEDSPPESTEILEELRKWEAADKKLWIPQEHGRRNALAARRDAYRRVAAWLAATAQRVVVDDTDIAAIARKRDDADVPNPVAERAAGQRVNAAPGELRAAVVAAAVRDGVRVVEVPHKGITFTCAGCGHVHDPEDARFAAAAVVACDGCRRSYDQDDNATRTMLNRAGVV